MIEWLKRLLRGRLCFVCGGRTGSRDTFLTVGDGTEPCHHQCKRWFNSYKPQEVARPPTTWSVLPKPGEAVEVYRTARYEGVVTVMDQDWDQPTGITLPDGSWMRLHNTDVVRPA